MLANYECDLHGHTNRSDGNDSPVEYIRHAVHRGVKILAITDHDIVPPEMIELGGGQKTGDYGLRKRYWSRTSQRN